MTATLANLAPGDELELVVRWYTEDPETFERREHERRGPVTVHYVRQRGDFQVDIPGVGRLWAYSDGHVRHYGRAHRAFVRRPREVAC